MSDKPHIRYVNMGQWPCYFGVCDSPKAFKAEMKRLKVKDCNFLARETAAATVHALIHKGVWTYILCIVPWKKAKVSREAYAALIAHEATHILQFMQESLANKRSLGCEADAYLVQQLVQEALQIAWKSDKEMATEP